MSSTKLPTGNTPRCSPKHTILDMIRFSYRNCDTSIAHYAPQEQLALMRTQDTRYLSLKTQQEENKMERLRGSLHFIGAEQRNQHTVFVVSSPFLPSSRRVGQLVSLSCASSLHL